METDVDDDMLQLYSGGGNSDTTSSSRLTFVDSSNKPKSLDRSFTKLISFSPCANKSKKFAERTDKGTVSFQFGLAKSSKMTNKSSKYSSSVSVENVFEKNALIETYKYMYQLPYDITIAISSALDELSNFVENDDSKENFNFVEVDCVESEDPVYIYGQIFSNDDGKLDVSSISLQGTRKNSKGKTVQLDINSLDTYSFFSGQFVAFQGVNPNGQRFIANKICFPQLPPQPEIVFEPNLDNLSVVIASGPFTTSDNLNYEPLIELMNYAVEHEPNVLILIGPLLPCKHDLISKNLVTLSFKEMFERVVKDFIYDRLTNCRTKVLIVSSTKDVFHDPIYPCPPYRIKKESHVSDKIQFASDPSLLRIGGIVFGLTSTDVLFDLCKIEISNSPVDRMSRLLEHLFLQRNFYPLYPPSEQLNVDYTQFYTYAAMPIRPHVMITPSNLKHFIKDVSDVVCVNPGNLSKGEGGGTFCRMEIRSSQLASRCKLVECIAAEILKI